jgi:hypothetical protein
MPTPEKARQEQIREEVSQKLEGLEFRQEQRNAARALVRRMKIVQKLRREHALDKLEEARDLLVRGGLHANEELYYGITLLHTNASTVLAYDREGKISWTSRPRKEKLWENPQEAFDFSSETSDDPSSDDWVFPI